MSKNGEKSLQKWTILMLLLRNLLVHNIISNGAELGGATGAMAPLVFGLEV